jgi:hypothetical protein
MFLFEMIGEEDLYPREISPFTCDGLAKMSDEGFAGVVDRLVDGHVDYVAGYGRGDDEVPGTLALEDFSGVFCAVDDAIDWRYECLVTLIEIWRVSREEGRNEPLTAMISRYDSRLISSMGFDSAVPGEGGSVVVSFVGTGDEPAFATKTSSLPKSSTTCAIAFCTASASVTLTLYAFALVLCVLENSSAFWMAVSFELYHITTFALASAKPSDTASPMPDEAPLTTTTLPSIRNCSMTLLGVSGVGRGNPSRVTWTSSRVIDIAGRDGSNLGKTGKLKRQMRDVDFTIFWYSRLGK